MVHPLLLPVVKDAFSGLGIDSADAKKRIILATWGFSGSVQSDYLSMEVLLHSGQLEREVIFDGEDAYETALMCYSSGTTGHPKGVEVLILPN